MTTYKKSFDIDSVLKQKMTEYLTESRNSSKTPDYNSSHLNNLPEVYSGAPNRVERYSQYESMALDCHIDASLDIIAEFCTQVDPVSQLPFVIQHTETPTESETNILNRMLRAWVNTNDFENNLFNIFRDTLQFGDQFFIRDPETYQWLRVYHGNVEKAIVNESKGKKPEYYVIKDLDLNMQNLTATQLPTNLTQGMLPGIPGTTFAALNQNTMNISTNQGQTRFGNDKFHSSHVNAEHVIHINMSKRGDPNWPFGSSILDKVFKSYKQKELLEDSILIYRIQRAPMRRIFYVDVGEMPANKANSFIEQVKNSVNQRRIPTKNGQGQSVMDAAYSPLSMLDDFFFPQRSDGRGSKIDTLPGGETSWGMDELQYFDNKLARGLRIPSSYLPTGPDDSTATYNDGKVGTALIQEYRFAEYCKRIQRTFSKTFDNEFKLYLKMRDVNIDASSFNLQFVEPQSFVTWRQIEIDSSRINNFNQMAQNPFISKRFAQERWLGLTPDEINKNHEMFIEENPTRFKDINNVDKMINNESPVDLRDVGINKNMFDSQNMPPQEENASQENNSEENLSNSQENTPNKSENPPTT